jgi:hypothetical protein
MACPHPPGSARSGAPPPSAASCTTRPTSAGSTSTAPSAFPTTGPADAPNRYPAPATNGSPSPFRPLWTTARSKRLTTSPATTASGAHAAPNQANGCYAAWSSVAPAASGSTATRCAAATAPGTATTAAATTTRSGPADPTNAARNATSAPTPSTPSSSTHIRTAPLRPHVLATGEQAVAAHTPLPDDELLAAELARLDRRLHNIDAERHRLVDLYQTALIDLPELQRRAADTDTRRRDLQQRRDALTTQRQELARDNQIRTRVAGFAHRVLAVIDQLTFDQRQQLLRLVIDEVRVIGWNVTIPLRIPLDEPPEPPPCPPSVGPNQPTSAAVSTEDRLRSLGDRVRSGLQAG